MRLRPLLIGFGSLLLLLVGVVLIRSFLSRSVQLDSSQPVTARWESGSPELGAAARHLAGSVRLAPVTHEDTTRIDAGIFQALHDSLASWYPLTHASLERERVGQLGLLYTWPGVDASAPAVVLASHLDVVPVPEGTEGQWQVDPFGGVIEDGFVWGRGAIDDKSSVIGVLEAVEALLRNGFQPAQTVYLAFGGDEERGGYLGAAQMADRLSQRGVRASLVLDEGLFIVDGVVPGVDVPVALIGVAEKGAANIRLSVEVEGGHASMPHDPTALGLLSRAIDRLTTRPLEPSMAGVPEAMFSALAPEMGWLQRMVFANLWLFEPLVVGQLEASPSSNALIRTTVAPTIFEAGTKVNVLPAQAQAFLNVRLRPGDSVSAVVDQLTERIDDDRVRVDVMDGASEPSAITPTTGPAWDLMAQTMRNVYPEAVVAPALMIARTDSRHYATISDHIFKITPVLMTSDDLKRVHGVDERLSLDNLARSIQFYQELIRGAAALTGE